MSPQQELQKKSATIPARWKQSNVSSTKDDYSKHTSSHKNVCQKFNIEKSISSSPNWLSKYGSIKHTESFATSHPGQTSNYADCTCQFLILVDC